MLLQKQQIDKYIEKKVKLEQKKKVQTEKMQRLHLFQKYQSRTAKQIKNLQHKINRALLKDQKKTQQTDQAQNTSNAHHDRETSLSKNMITINPTTGDVFQVTDSSVDLIQSNLQGSPLNQQKELKPQSKNNSSSALQVEIQQRPDQLVMNDITMQQKIQKNKSESPNLRPVNNKKMISHSRDSSAFAYLKDQGLQADFAPISPRRDSNSEQEEEVVSLKRNPVKSSKLDTNIASRSISDFNIVKQGYAQTFTNSNDRSFSKNIKEIMDEKNIEMVQQLFKESKNFRSGSNSGERDDITDRYVDPGSMIKQFTVDSTLQDYALDQNQEESHVSSPYPRSIIMAAGVRKFPIHSSEILNSIEFHGMKARQIDYQQQMAKQQENLNEATNNMPIITVDMQGNNLVKKSKGSSNLPGNYDKTLSQIQEI